MSYYGGGVTNDQLLDALERLRGTGAEFGGFLANHGPMGAEALVAVGAGDQAPQWATRYRTRRDLQSAPQRATAFPEGEWRLATGDVRRLAEWTATLRRDLTEAPWRTVLVTWWPRLLPGLAASATHGVIRTAHAVRALAAAGPEPDPLLVDELAQGLALWGARYLPLPGQPGLAGHLSAREALARLPRSRPEEPVAGAGISGVLGRLTRVDGFARGLEGYRPPADAGAALDELITAAALVLWTHPDQPINFCHAVTGPAAVRVILPHLPTELHPATIAATWQVMAGIIAATSPDPARDGLDRALPAGDREPPPDPATILGRAVAHGDEHVVKLSEAAVREHRRTGDPVLLHAAHAFLDRLPPLAG